MTKTPQEPARNEFDLVVCGATPAGIAAAVRAARGGLRVLLTQHTDHLGGMCTNGLGQWDAQSDHRRCPIFAEVLEAVETHYRETYGPGSPQHVAASYDHKTHPVASYEPYVVEGVFNRLVAAERHLTVWTGVYPDGASVRDGRIESVDLAGMSGNSRRTVGAAYFVDATYEGDLAAVAGAPYRVGREARDEFGEPHAGFALIKMEPVELPPLIASGQLLVHIHGTARRNLVSPESPHTADGHIQAYNLRGCVCRDPQRRILLDAPPANYDRSEYLHYTRKGLAIKADINGKNSYNSAILPGENWDYPEGDWAKREAITRRHIDFALGWMWFLQNDPSVPAEKQAAAREWGLPSDEYTDNGYLPYEIYVRETRRIVGRHVLTENDLTPQPGRIRPPVFEDSIAFTDWYMDSHSCSRDLHTYAQGAGLTGTPAYPADGKLILTENFRPGMIPYRSLVTAELENLIVPVCCSVTHVAWGSVRLEPCWIHLGEVAGFAVLQARARREPLHRLDVTRLQQTLLDAGAAVAFFNPRRDAAAAEADAEHQLAACHGEVDAYDP